MGYFKRNKVFIISILIAAVYGLVARIGFGAFNQMNSFSYLFVVPAVMGAIPHFVKSDEKRKVFMDWILIPWLSVLVFFFLTMMFKLEGFICLVILAAPFMMFGTLIGLIVRLIQINKKNKNKLMISIMLIPAIFNPIENMMVSPSKDYEVRNEVVIDASKEVIWSNIIQVDEIKAEEYNSGAFQYLGIPRPIKATVSYSGQGAERIGYFSGGLKFVEVIETFEPLKKAEFSIKLDEGSLRNVAFDHHVLNGNYFHFNTATYKIEERNGQLILSLTSSYFLKSKLNFYGAFWGGWMLDDFQARLLEVIKNRCELKLSNHEV